MGRRALPTTKAVGRVICGSAGRRSSVLQHLDRANKDPADSLAAMRGVSETYASRLRRRYGLKVEQARGARTSAAASWRTASSRSLTCRCRLALEATRPSPISARFSTTISMAGAGVDRRELRGKSAFVGGDAGRLGSDRGVAWSRAGPSEAPLFSQHISARYGLAVAGTASLILVERGHGTWWTPASTAALNGKEVVLAGGGRSTSIVL